MNVDNKKARAIKLAFNDHLSTAEIAERLDVSERTVRRWKAAYNVEGIPSLRVLRV